MKGLGADEVVVLIVPVLYVILCVDFLVDTRFDKCRRGVHKDVRIG